MHVIVLLHYQVGGPIYVPLLQPQESIITSCEEDHQDL